MRESDQAPESNRSSNEAFSELLEHCLETSLDRRQLIEHMIRGGLGLATVSMFGGSLAGCGHNNGSAPASSSESTTKAHLLPFSFQNVSPSTADTVQVPIGYTASVLFAWGDPIGMEGFASGQPAFRPDAGNTAEEQAAQGGRRQSGKRPLAV